MSGFKLDPAFEPSSEPVASLPLCAVRLQQDARWPWLVLIPRRADARELGDLSAADRLQLWAEIDAASAAVRALGAALGRPVETLNVAKIGNVTPQLHLHVVGRCADDPLWPKPVWGAPGALAYTPEALAPALSVAGAALADSGVG